MHRARNGFGAIAATAAILRKSAEAGNSSCRCPVLKTLNKVWVRLARV
jgi:hypothetical protein